MSKIGKRKKHERSGGKKEEEPHGKNTKQLEINIKNLKRRKNIIEV